MSKFERELRKLDCSVNYHKAGRGRKGGNMLTVGYEAEILNLLRKLNVRKEINNQSTLLGKGKFICQNLKENCGSSVNYHKAGRGRKGGKKGWELV